MMRCFFKLTVVFSMLLFYVSTAASSGWVRYDTKCYKAFTNKNDSVYAQDFCGKLTGRLAEPRKREENRVVKKAAACGKSYCYWIGVNDTEKEGTFVYASDKKPISFSQWASGQPSSEDCVCLKANEESVHHYYWHACQCNTTCNPVCERNVAENERCIDI